MSVRHHRNRYPSHHPNSKTAGASLFALAFILGWILKILQFILPFLLLAGLAAIVYAVSRPHTTGQSVTQSKKDEKRSFPQLPEKTPEPRAVGKANPQASKEEIQLHEAFCDYVQAYNQYEQAEAHFQWLQKRQSYQTELRCSEAVVTNEELQKAKDEKNARFAALDTVALSIPQASASSKERDDLFHKLTAPLIPISTDPFLGPFFQKLPVFRAQDTQTTQFLFSPWCVFVYYPDSNHFSLLQYTDVTVRSEITTVRLDGRFGPTDEIAETHWRYEKKDGGRDFRYKDNPMYTYVYKGAVIFSGPQVENRVSFPNKSQTEEYLAHVKNFLSLRKSASKPTAALTEKRPAKPAKKAVVSKTKKRQEAVPAADTRRNESQLFPELQPGAVLHHKTFGIGVLTSVEGNLMSVRFGGCEKKFLYPQAIQKGYFLIDEVNE